MIFLRRFFGRKQNWLAVALLALIFGTAVAAPLLSPPDVPGDTTPFRAIASTFYQLPEPPRPGSPFGSVPSPPISGPGIAVGQGASTQWDIYHTLIWGTRSALRFGLVATVVTAVFGTIVGAVSAYVGGVFEEVAMRVTDSFLAFPVIAGVWLLERTVFSYASFTALFSETVELTPLQQVLSSLNIDAVLAALILFSWMPYARIIHAAVTQLKEADFVLAAQSLGARGGRVLFRHLLPNVLAPTIVMAAKDVGGMVILASAFIFIGIGGLRDLAWGVVLVGGRDYVIGFGGNPFTYWWTFLPIALAIIVFGIAWNLLGDGLNDVMNPRRRR
jgi:peptide/nickel transport system permease protein